MHWRATFFLLSLRSQVGQGFLRQRPPVLSVAGICPVVVVGWGGIWRTLYEETWRGAYDDSSLHCVSYVRLYFILDCRYPLTDALNLREPTWNFQKYDHSFVEMFERPWTPGYSPGTIQSVAFRTSVRMCEALVCIAIAIVVPNTVHYYFSGYGVSSVRACAFSILTFSKHVLLSAARLVALNRRVRIHQIYIFIFGVSLEASRADGFQFLNAHST